MRIKETIAIAAPVETVWRVLTEMERWPEWNTVCRECRVEGGRHMAEGACISFRLDLLVFPVRIAPEIKECERGKSLTWAGAKWGVRATHAFLLHPADAGTCLESIEVFSGPMLWAARLFGFQGRLHRLTQRMLCAIRAEAEYRARQKDRGAVSGGKPVGGFHHFQ